MKRYSWGRTSPHIKLHTTASTLQYNNIRDKTNDFFRVYNGNKFSYKVSKLNIFKIDSSKILMLLASDCYYYVPNHIHVVDRYLSVSQQKLDQ